MIKSLYIFITIFITIPYIYLIYLLLLKNNNLVSKYILNENFINKIKNNELKNFVLERFKNKIKNYKKLEKLIIKDNKKVKNIYFRILNNKKIPIYIYNNIVLTELQNSDKINFYRYIYLHKNNGLYFSKGDYLNEENDCMYIINNKIYINLLSDIEIIKMDGYIQNIGNILCDKFTISDIIAIHKTLPHYVFNIIITSYCIIFIFIISNNQNISNNKKIFLLLIMLLASYITTFDFNSKSYKYKNVLHFICAFCFFLFMPLLFYFYKNDIIVKILITKIIFLTITFIYFLFNIPNNTKIILYVEFMILFLLLILIYKLAYDFYN